MRNPDEFDAFYKDARDRLLLQTYALTGDLPASRAAVRDSFVVAWHHWRKISRLDDPEAWARPHAWSHAQRRHTARLWHRDKTLEPEARATLEALAKLPVAQRKVLLLTQLTTASMVDMAREVGRPRAEAERELQTATAQFAVHRGVPTTTIRSLFEPLREHAEEVRWPRPSIIRRAGAARRRTHTTLGAAAAVAALAISGSLVTDTAGVRPALARERLTSSAPTPGSHTTPSPPPPEALPAASMLGATDLKAVSPGRTWQVRRTSEDTAAAGMGLPCAPPQYADPKGVAGLVRTFRADPARGQSKLLATQATEASASDGAARKAFATMRAWFGECQDRRVQLIATNQVAGVGDAAVQLVLRSWKRPVNTMVVGLARTGVFTTTTVQTITAPGQVTAARSARVLGTAVDLLCTETGAGACTEGQPAVQTRQPLPSGQWPAMLGVLDLPPVSGVERPWVATPPKQARTNVAATQCDDTSFSTEVRGKAFSNASTRSFLILKAKLPDEFGLTETQGSLPVRAAGAFVDGVRTRLSRCPDKQLGTKVRRTVHVTTARQDLTVWHLTTEISDKKSLSVAMAILRDGTSVAQVSFVPAPGALMHPGAFEALARRALERLRQQPPPSP